MTNHVVGIVLADGEIFSNLHFTQRLYDVLHAQGAIDPATLAGGIWVALTTTAVGLAIAIVAFFIATWLEGRIDRERNMIEAVISAAIHGRVDPSAGRH